MTPSTSDTTTTTSDADAGGFDPGPAFDPDAVAAPDELPEPTPPLELLTVPQMKQMLRDAGEGAHSMLGPEDIGCDLRLTDLEISLMAPGLVRYANSRPAVLATFTGADYLKLAAGTGLATTRMWKERRDHVAERMAAEQQGAPPVLVDVARQTPGDRRASDAPPAPTGIPPINPALAGDAHGEGGPDNA